MPSKHTAPLSRAASGSSVSTKGGGGGGAGPSAAAPDETARGASKRTAAARRHAVDRMAKRGTVTHEAREAQLVHLGCPSVEGTFSATKSV